VRTVRACIKSCGWVRVMPSPVRQAVLAIAVTEGFTGAGAMDRRPTVSSSVHPRSSYADGTALSVRCRT
jgi:hypothetical protein